MAATKTTISLSHIAGEASYVDGVPALCPGDEPAPVIVERCGDTTFCIVDGFHRTRGYCLWADEQGLCYDAVKITVVVCDDGDLIAAAAEPGDGQCEAIEAIYEMAGL